MYFKFYKLKSWVKRSAVRRRRFDQRFLKQINHKLLHFVFSILHFAFSGSAQTGQDNCFMQNLPVSFREHQSQAPPGIFPFCWWTYP